MIIFDTFTCNRTTCSLSDLWLGANAETTEVLQGGMVHCIPASNRQCV